MIDDQFALRIKSALDAGLGVSPEVGARLRVAREHALDRLSVARVAVLLSALFAVHHWQQGTPLSRFAPQLVQELIDVDTGLLTSELPIDAYLDEGFRAWLKQSSE